MKVITEGHKYELQNFEQSAETGQTIQFIQKEADASDPTHLNTINDGTTNEEVLAVIETALLWLNKCRRQEYKITHT